MKELCLWFKEKRINNGIKKYALFLLFFIFLELFFHLIIFDGLSFEGVINLILSSSIFASLFAILTNIFKEKGNFVVGLFLFFVVGVLFSIQIVFYNVFKTFFSFAILGLGDQLESFMGETIKNIFHNWFYILVVFIPFILFIILRKKVSFKRSNLWQILFFIFILIISIFFFIVHISIGKKDSNSTYYLLHEVNNNSLNIEKLGVMNGYMVDVYRTIFGFEEVITIDEEVLNNEEKQEIIEPIAYEKNILDLNFNKQTSNKEIKTINNYMLNNLGTFKNEWTGKYQGYNLIYIVAESFSEIAIREDLTPTLYKLTHTGLVFDNYYTPNTLSTIGGEFQALTGLYPDSSILNKWRKGTNYFPYGLATVYKSLGYKTYAYHNNWYGFQDRHKYLKSQGFTNYIGCKNGMEKRMNCNKWPQSDLEMMKATVKDYLYKDEPFLAYYMTVSGHFSYNFSDNSMAYKNRKYVNKLSLSTSAKAYLATQIELDRALEFLLGELDKAQKLDNTVIVLLADHYPYKLDLKAINSLSTYKRDNVVEVNHNALILWNNTQEETHITKPCMSSDVLPTIYNLFGISYDSRLFTGQDIFSDSDGLVIMGNHSWVTDKGTYYASSRKFVHKEEVENGYVDKINNVVKNRLAIAKYIIKNDYYKYLLK